MSQLPSCKIAEHLQLRNHSMIPARYAPSRDLVSHLQCMFRLSGVASLFSGRPYFRLNIGISSTCKRSLLTSLVLITSALGGCTKGDVGPSASLSSRYTLPRHVSYSINLENQSMHVIRGAELWVFAPVSQTSTQRCDRVEASHPHDVLTDELGNQVLHFRIETIPPYGSKILRIRANLSLSDTPNCVESGNLQNFLKPETFIQSDRREILSLARGIRSQDGASRPEEYFGWVSRNIGSAGYSRNDRGALDCLARRRGDCTEQAYLFTALCRAARIPARVMGGYVCDTDCVLAAEDYHNWSEFRQGECWYVADPRERVFAKNPSRYVAMRVLGDAAGMRQSPMESFQRFRVQGDGLKARMN
jgi:hypothetical protein